jgi:hypothetical protein
MRRQMASFALMVCGALALALGLTVAPAPTAVSAMPALQPSPRPTLQPTPDFIPDDDDDDEPTPVPYGRVTGTVIDTRTGAPAANMLVVVGDSLVLTDGSGNYDRWVPAGSYRVALQLRDGEGVVAQSAQEVGVTPSGTAVMHLFFTSPAPVVPQAPTTEPTPTAVPTPPLAMEPEQPVSQPAATAPMAPAGLPDTAVGISVPGPLVLVGALLFGLGALLQLRPRRRSAARAQADARMLRRMLAEDPEREPLDRETRES